MSGGLCSGEGVSEDSDEEPQNVDLTPKEMVLSKELFEQYLLNRAFASWEEFVQALPEQRRKLHYEDRLQEGASTSIVKLDPLHIFAWVATFLMEVFIWGTVAYFSYDQPLVGMILAAVFGVILWYVVSHALAPQLAGMLWPNLPCVVGAVGVLVIMAIHQTTTPSATDVLLFCALPATAASAFWLRGVRDDPDRAVLVTNLFLGVWACIVCIFSLFGFELFNESHYDVVTSTTVAGGAVCLGISYYLQEHPGEWSSVELISWTLNVGVLAVYCGMCLGLDIPMGEPVQWFAFAGVVAFIGMLGRVFNRTFPLLLCALGVVTIAFKLAFTAGEVFHNNVIAILATFGALGLCIILGAQQCLGSGGSQRAQSKGYARHADDNA